MKRYFGWAFLVAGVVLSANGYTDLIPNAISGVTATGHHQGDTNNGDGSIRTAVDGTGLTVGNPLDQNTWTHSNRWQDDWQGTWNTAASDGWMVLDLGASYNDLETLWIWNVTEGSHTDRGTQSFQLYFAETPTILPPSVGAFQTYDFNSGGWTSLGGLETLPQGGTNLSGTFDLSSISSARYIGLDLQSSFGATNPNRVGLSEVQITTQVVPEPSVLALMALGLPLLRFLRRK